MAQEGTSFSLEKVQEAIDYIEENLLLELTPDKIAAMWYLWKVEFCTIFMISTNL